jgi:hypothetical protein
LNPYARTTKSFLFFLLFRLSNFALRHWTEINLCQLLQTSFFTGWLMVQQALRLKIKLVHRLSE